MTDGVKTFLSSLGMSKYHDIFKAKGYDLESDIPYLTEREFKDVLMINNERDKDILLSKAQTFTPSPEHALYEWLRGHSLDYYFVSFLQSDLANLNTIAGLQLPDEDLYDELEIMLPGHRSRLERAVTKLRMDKARDINAETPVTYGWWGKPKCLPQAMFDFLCVRAFLFSHKTPRRRVAVDFMVDSGSDVSTVQESILEGLGLDLIGPVYSCGVHGGNHCNLYRGMIAIGGHVMDIEVMGSNYDSIGSRVVRHFRHVIDGYRHIWLPGNYRDPLPAILPLQIPSLPTPSIPVHKALPDASFSKDLDVKLSAEVSKSDGDHHSAGEEVLAQQEYSSPSNKIHSPKSPSLNAPFHAHSSTLSNCNSVDNREDAKEANGVSSNATSSDSVNKFPPSSEQNVKECGNLTHIQSNCLYKHGDSAATTSGNVPSSNLTVDSTNKLIHLKSITEILPNSNTPDVNSYSKHENDSEHRDFVYEESVKLNKSSINSNITNSGVEILASNMRDTDDDVDYHHSTARQTVSAASKSKSRIFYSPTFLDLSNTETSAVVDKPNIKSDRVLSQTAADICSPLSAGTPGKLDNKPDFTCNLVQASSNAVLLTLDDLDDMMTPETDPSPSLSSSSVHSQGHHLVCEAAPVDVNMSLYRDVNHCPVKKRKIDDS